MKTVAVIGGGVAGIAVSVALAEAGVCVHLFEKRPMLGGRASSYIDPETGETLDACQHGTMRCCTNLARLLEKLSVHHLVKYHDAIHFLDSDGKRSVIKGCGLPAPSHTAVSFALFRSLGFRDKASILRGLIAMLRTSMTDDLDETDIREWFLKTRQTERAVRRFWEPILVSACNEELERISCFHAFKIFRDGFLLHPKAFHFGIPSVPLGDLYTESTCEFLSKRKNSVVLKTIVDSLIIENGSVVGVKLRNGEEIQTDGVVSALQFDLLLKMLPNEFMHGYPYFQNLAKLELSPIVGVHIWFDRFIECPESLALLDRRTDWIFNKSLNFGLDAANGTYLSMVVSADRSLTALSATEILDIVLAEVKDCLPDAKNANLLRYRVVKERKATFSPKPGVEKLRPDQKSPIPGLYIAGEWTRTGWPSTMESAARSGFLAAEKILSDFGTPATILASDLPVCGINRLIARI